MNLLDATVMKSSARQCHFAIVGDSKLSAKTARKASLPVEK